MSKDVWELVSENSTLEDGDFWEHLNNQKVGSMVVFGDGLEITVDSTDLMISIENNDMDVSIDVDAFVVELDDEISS